MLTVLLIASVIVAVCVIIHTVGLVLLAEHMLRRRSKLIAMGMSGHIATLLWVFAAILLLHVFETAIWAGFYRQWDLFPDFETAWYFSLTSYSTIGFGDVTLPQRWRLFGGIEGITGVLLCGISTAFIFVIVNAIVFSRVPGANGQGKPGGLEK